MLKEFLIVGAGSFIGGGMRYAVSRLLSSAAVSAALRGALPALQWLPIGTLTVNVLGCLAIGFLSGLPAAGPLSSPNAKAFLATGFCGGFTTFSTFINENSAIMGGRNFIGAAIYTSASLLLGFIALYAGHRMARACL